MNDRHLLGILRRVLVILSIVCLVGVVFFMFRMIVSDNDSSEASNATAPVAVEHRVLFISSYNPLYFAYDAQIKGLKEGLYPNNIEYDISYLDSKNYSREEDVRAFHDFIKSRMGGNRNYEAILIGDDDALRFALDNQQELFPGLPIVFFGVNDLNLARMAQARANFTGYFERSYLSETLQIATKLFPERENIVALHDTTSAGAADAKLFYNLRINYPACSFSEINTSEMTDSEIASALEELSDDSMLVYMTAYKDGEGNTYSMESRTDFIVDHTRVPIFRNYIGGEGMGILGGVCMDIEGQCRDAGQLTADLLAGKKDISGMRLNDVTPGYAQFDYEVMEKYNLNADMLPEDAIIYNRPESLTEIYGSILVPVGPISLALMMMIAASQMSVRIARIANAELMRTRDDLELSKEEMQYRAEHDDLMGLINRRTAREWLKDELTPDKDFSV
ncbi:MAG: hypothetical protein IJV16_03530, partial [Lachnospiraceae bacterium]|nr:hypothetical protein [Lachnospiraceae bacterium]